MTSDEELARCDVEAAEAERLMHEENAHWVLGMTDWENERALIEGKLTGEEIKKRLTKMYSCHDGSCGSCEYCCGGSKKAVIQSSSTSHYGNPTLVAADRINELAARVHHANKKWWVDITTGEPIKRNVGEILMLAVSELAEAMEGHRKNLPDDKLPHRSMFEVEIADCLIRLLDIAAGMGLDLGGAFEEKMQYNATRRDHTREARLEENGKKY